MPKAKQAVSKKEAAKLSNNKLKGKKNGKTIVSDVNSKSTLPIKNGKEKYKRVVKKTVKHKKKK